MRTKILDTLLSYYLSTYDLGEERADMYREQLNSMNETEITELYEQLIEEGEL